MVDNGFLEKRVEQQKALQNIQNGLATKVRILTHRDCCPYCMAMEGAYTFENVPALPHEECSHPNGCRCFYAPILDQFGP